MPLNISVFNVLALRYGAMQAAPTLNDQVASQVVALAAAAAPIVGPCLVCLIPDEDQRIAASPGAAVSAANGIKLKAGAERWFDLPKGNWTISVVAG